MASEFRLPGWDIFSGSKHLSKLGSREILNRQALLLRILSSNVVLYIHIYTHTVHNRRDREIHTYFHTYIHTYLFLGVYEVERWNRSDSHELGVGNGEVLRVIRAVEVIS